MAQVVHPRRIRRPRPPLARRPPTASGIAARPRSAAEALLAWACFLSAGLHAAALLWLAAAAPAEPPASLAVQAGRSSIELRASVAGRGAPGEPDASPRAEIVPSSDGDAELRAEAASSPARAAAPPAEPLDCRAGGSPRPAVASLPLPGEPSQPADLPPATRVALSSPARIAQVEPTPSAPPPPRSARGVPAGDQVASDALDIGPPAPASPGSRAAEGADVDDLPVAVANPAPVYPPELLAARATGTVRLRIRVSADGRVAAAEVAEGSGHEAFDRAALRAVRRWRFRPARRDGRAVAVEVVQRVHFVLPDD